MRTRYTLDASTGLLVDRDGNMLGRVVSITLDDKPTVTTEHLGDRAHRSLETSSPLPGKETDVVPHTPRPTATQLEREAVQRIWGYWIEIAGKKQRLDSKRERIIRNALGLVGEDAVKKALLGLSRNPFHKGQNEQHREYLEIRHALKGKGDESDDERIEKAISWAAIYSDGLNTKADPARVQRWLEDVRYTISLPHRPERQRALDAHNSLTAAGFHVERLDGPPWARLSR